MVVTPSASAQAPAAFGLQSDKPIRVLHLVHWLNRGGIEKWLLDFFQATDRGRFEMDLCCKGPAVGILAPEFQRMGVQVIHHPLGWNHGRFGRRLSGTLTGGNYDILHVQAGIFAGYPAGIGRRAGVEVVTTFHSTVFREERNTDQAGGRWGPIAGLRANLRSWYGKWSLRGACENSDVVIACSRAVAQSVTGTAGAIAPDKLRVLACGTTKSPGRDPSQSAG